MYVCKFLISHSNIFLGDLLNDFELVTNWVHFQMISQFEGQLMEQGKYEMILKVLFFFQF